MARARATKQASWRLRFLRGNGNLQQARADAGLVPSGQLARPSDVLSNKHAPFAECDGDQLMEIRHGTSAPAAAILKLFGGVGFVGRYMLVCGAASTRLRPRRPAC